ncbi:helix-turn-helix domain-containing protein [Acinetobacter sp. V91_7]|uniref:helix-turn-helix domain-containing protein n=1 Tax=unclassified Acinetobacter TaxID=196816 RepID=UPI00287CABF3|nr:MULTISPECIES: helix-turn-helix domain-containing protein [unclassified Acinetobacter]MDS7935643.1 helix-turn-helix domain-containing protein [Acinetobacter sp. V91_4B]MDS7964749.1 helix-turn-helix domain-containing protein [Acinetobacter sp. V91_7]MDS8025556.1 helix-turn-helix domain-containing protein [Acinetobacter sp. V91_13]
METLGTRLKQLRKVKKLTQQQLADVVGVSKTSVIYWEKDENIPKHESLLALAKALDTTPEWLLTGKDPEVAASQFENNVPQFKKLDIEAFKKKYNIPDSEDAVKFIEMPVQPFPPQKRYVPVKAYSKMGLDGYFTDMGYEGNGGDGYVPTHTAGARAYGIKGTGDSMFPAIRNGWYVVCDPDAELVPMEFVQVCLKDGRCTIKEFIGIQNDVLSLIAVNGGERLTFNMDEVESITAITDIVPPSQHRQEHPQAH